MTNKQYENLEKARNVRWINALAAQERRAAQKEYAQMLNSFDEDLHRRAVDDYYDRMQQEYTRFGEDSDYDYLYNHDDDYPDNFRR